MESIEAVDVGAGPVTNPPDRDVCVPRSCLVAREPGARRVLFVEPAVLHVASPSGRSRLAVETVDIGAGGARIIAPEAVGLDAEMHLEVLVPVRRAAVHLELPAVLRWTINLRETVLACRGYLHGLGFEGLTAGQLADLLRLVRDVGVADRQVKRRARDRARA